MDIGHLAIWSDTSHFGCNIYIKLQNFQRRSDEGPCVKEIKNTNHAENKLNLGAYIVVLRWHHSSDKFNVHLKYLFVPEYEAHVLKQCPYIQVSDETLYLFILVTVL